MPDCKTVIMEMIRKIKEGTGSDGYTTVAIPAGKLQLCALEWAVRSGKWKETKNLKGETVFECSVCGGIGDYDNFCRICGADMNGDEAE